MRITENRIPILVAVLVAFIFGALPDPTQAQTPPAIGNFNAQNCFNNMQNAYTDTVQGHTQAQQKIIANGPIPSFKVVNCWSSTIQPIINSITSLTTIFSGTGSGIGGAISGLLNQLIQMIMTQLVNKLCQLIASAVQSAIAMLKNWMCIPLPHFKLSLNFGGGFFQKIGGSHNCQGINLLQLAGILGGGRVQVPSTWRIWNLNGQY